MTTIHTTDPSDTTLFEKPTLEEARRSFPRVTDAGLREAIDKGYLFHHKGTWLVDDIHGWNSVSSRSLKTE